MFESNIYEVMSFVMLVIAFLAWCSVAVCITYRRYEERRRKRKVVDATEPTGSDQLWHCMNGAAKEASRGQERDNGSYGAEARRAQSKEVVDAQGATTPGQYPGENPAG